MTNREIARIVADALRTAGHEGVTADDGRVTGHLRDGQRVSIKIDLHYDSDDFDDDQP